MLTLDNLSDALRDLLARLGDSPDRAYVLDLVSRAEPHRPVAIDATAATAAVRPYTWLLDRIGDDGIALTGHGHLPPSVVTETMAALEWHDRWYGKFNREAHTLPVLELRESAQRLGLARKHRGRLLRTRVGARLAADPVALWRHLAGHLPEGREEVVRDAGVLVLLAAAAALPLGHDTREDVLVRGLAAIGWRDAVTREPVRTWDAFQMARPTLQMLIRIGAVPDDPLRDDVPPTADGVLFARAALRRQQG